MKGAAVKKQQYSAMMYPERTNRLKFVDIIPPISEQ